MIFLEELVDPLFKLTRAMYEAHAASYEDRPTREEADKWLTLAKKASMAVRKRLFVVMQAHAQGWGFARTLNFYQEGIFENICL